MLPQLLHPLGLAILLDFFPLVLLRNGEKYEEKSEAIQREDSCVGLCGERAGWGACWHY